MVLFALLRRRRWKRGGAVGGAVGGLRTAAVAVHMDGVHGCWKWHVCLRYIHEFQPCFAWWPHRRENTQAEVAERHVDPVGGAALLSGPKYKVQELLEHIGIFRCKEHVDVLVG